MKVGQITWKVFKLIIFLALTLAALGVLTLVFWTQVRDWIYELGFRGVDIPQFVFSVTYYLKYPHLPVNAWDHFFFNGAPRTIDAAWLHHTLASFLAQAIGLYKTIKIYPIVSFALGVLFVYFLFYELSRSILLSLGLAISFVMGGGYYFPLFNGGVVLSAISQMFLPAQLYFLARFLKRGSYRNLLLGSLMSVLGLASHGNLMMFFGFIPASIFVLFSNRETNALITKKTIFNAFIFGAVTFTVGAYVIWPFLQAALQGGFVTGIFAKVKSNPEIIRAMFAFTDQGIIYGFILSVPIALIFWLIRKRFDKTVRPVLAILIFYLLWMGSCTYTGNPLYGSMFPGRFYWVWPLFLGCLTAVLLAPLSEYQAPSLGLKTAKFLGFGLIKLAVFSAIIFSPITHFRDLDDFLTQIEIPQKWETYDITEKAREKYWYLLEMVDAKDTQFRLESRGGSVNLGWFHVSDIPLSEGYTRIFTRRGGYWQNRFYTVIAAPNWENQQIPGEMAKQQALFFLDWYGVKYFESTLGGEQREAAAYFYENPPYVERSKTFGNKRSVFVFSPEYVSPIVTSVNVPVVGFVGGEDAYMYFLKDIAMLNLNSSYLVPVKLSKTISGIPADKLALVDALVIYDFQKGNPLFYNNGWDKILNFVKNGGQAWIETGGNSIEKESGYLPAVFPITANKYGPLDENWQPGGKLAGKIDFSSLGPLVFQDTPWKISYSLKESVKSGAEVLLTQKGYPIAVIQEIGEGKVIWTGLNIWYRPEEFRHQKKGMNEAGVIRLFLDELFGELPRKRVQSQVKRDEPEHVEVVGQGFSGVVFKENSPWGGWQAVVEAGSKKERLPILTAGPELMYIPIPKEMRIGEIKVFIDYRGSPLYWFCLFVSLASLLVVILYLIFGNLILRPFRSMGVATNFRGLKKKISSWWESEEV